MLVKGTFGRIKIKLSKIIYFMMMRFVLYGLIGFIMEILWTGFGSLIKKDLSLKANTYLWMFFIYGCAIFLEPVFVLLSPMHFIARGIVYMLLIFCGEYTAGYFLERSVGNCPWDYGRGVGSIYGFIRLDYAPVWFVVGLFYEFVFKLVNLA